MKHIFDTRLALPAGLAIALAAWLAGCASTPPSPPPPVSTVVRPAQVVPPAQFEPQVSGVRTSNAATPRAYRTDAATHLYGLNQNRIYHGKMPPLLYAIGVLQVEVDSRGGVQSIHWMRAPTQAPEVMAEIERTVRAAAPFPAPARMGHVVYTDTWLWHKSGRFQLDTLTEGQL